MTKRLYQPNIEALGKVLDELNTSRITAFSNQSRFHVWIECIKFPHLMKWHEMSREHNFKKPFYVQLNFFPIINWLMDRKIISRKPAKLNGRKIIKWTVSKDALENLTDLSPTYNVILK